MRTGLHTTNSMSAEAPAVWQGNCLVWVADLCQENFPALKKCWQEATFAHLVVDFGTYDVLDGPSMAGLTRLLCDWLHLNRTLTLKSPPQLVVHNLYRVNSYPNPRLTVTDLREDEAYG